MVKRRYDAQLCWFCKNAVPSAENGCSWSESFEPVKGWKAEETTVMNAFNDNGSAKKHYTRTFKVKECPMFKEG